MERYEKARNGWNWGAWKWLLDREALDTPFLLVENQIGMYLLAFRFTLVESNYRSSMCLNLMFNQPSLLPCRIKLPYIKLNPVPLITMDIQLHRKI
jgi:hypothetical protein